MVDFRSDEIGKRLNRLEAEAGHLALISSVERFLSY